MNRKKAQVSIFAILGIFIFVLACALYFTLGKVNVEESIAEESSTTLENQADKAKLYVESCLNEIAVRGIFDKLGPQGGYIDPEYDAYYGDYDQVEWERSGNLKIPFWYYDGRDISPSLEQIETKIGRFVIIEGENCSRLEDISSFEGTDILRPKTDYYENLFDFSKEETYINVSILNTSVIIRYHYPITLVRGDKQKTIEDFVTEIPIALGADYWIAKDILSRAEESGAGGYDLADDCNEYKGRSMVDVVSFNKNVVITDYWPNLDSRFGSSFRFQYLVRGVSINGKC